MDRLPRHSSTVRSPREGSGSGSMVAVDGRGRGSGSCGGREPRSAFATRLLAVALLALAACPTSAPGLLERADELEARQQYTKAQQRYRDALRRLGDDESLAARSLRARALAHLADLCYLDLRDLRCATDAYRKLIEGHPEAPETFQARTHFAEMLRDRVGDLPGAIAQFKALAQAYPDRP